MQRCQCLAGSLNCPCRTSDPRCDDAQQMCDNANQVCMLASGVTVAPTPAPTLSLRQQCSAGNCSACIGCETCLFGARCGYCRSTGACVAGIADCSTDLVTGDWRNVCNENNNILTMDLTTPVSPPMMMTSMTINNHVAEIVVGVVSGVIATCVVAASVCAYKNAWLCFRRNVRHDSQTYECRTCGNLYDIESDLKTHIQNKHVGTQCKNCS